MNYLNTHSFKVRHVFATKEAKLQSGISLRFLSANCAKKMKFLQQTKWIVFLVLEVEKIRPLIAKDFNVLLIKYWVSKENNFFFVDCDNYALIKLLINNDNK